MLRMNYSASMNTILSRLAVLLALLVALVLLWLALSKSGGCDRDVPDEDPEPACKPTDKECKVGKPSTPTPPPIGAPP